MTYTVSSGTLNLTQPTQPKSYTLKLELKGGKPGSSNKSRISNTIQILLLQEIRYTYIVPITECSFYSCFF